jgi:hypothetical protein
MAGSFVPDLTMAQPAPARSLAWGHVKLCHDEVKKSAPRRWHRCPPEPPASGLVTDPSLVPSAVLLDTRFWREELMWPSSRRRNAASLWWMALPQRG